jgi:preprotein translocase subunit SecD
MKRMTWVTWAIFGIVGVSGASLLGGAEPPRVKIEFRLGQKEEGKGLEKMMRPGSKDQFIYVHKKAVLTNADIASAKVVKRGKGRSRFPALQFTFAKSSRDKVSKWTSENVGKHIAIFVDDKLFAAAKIHEKLSQEAELSGNFTEEEAQRIAKGIKAK